MELSTSGAETLLNIAKYIFFWKLNLANKVYQNSVDQEIRDDFRDHVSHLSYINSEIMIQSLPHFRNQELISFFLSFHDLFGSQLVDLI